jgi:hypothetical protein
MAILKQYNWKMASNILKNIFIIGKHTPHNIDLTCNKYIKWNFISWCGYSLFEFEFCYQVATIFIGNCLGIVIYCLGVIKYKSPSQNITIAKNIDNINNYIHLCVKLLN